MITLKKNAIVGVILLWLVVAINALAAEQKINLSPLFIQLSDAMRAVNEDNAEQAKHDIERIQRQFMTIPQHSSPAGAAVITQLQKAIDDTNIEQLNRLSIALLAFDKEQHPLDVAAQKKQFKKRIVPAFSHWRQVVLEQKTQPEVAVLKQQYRLFNAVWTKNERLVRDVDMRYYGKIETALALLRVAIETEPLDYQRVEQNTENIAVQFAAFLSGETVKSISGNYQLRDGVDLLKAGLTALQQQDKATAQEKLTTFIEIWPMIEGEVSTRNASLYTRVESQLPVILAKGQQANYQADLQQLIEQLAAINPTARYTAIDAMLILLREGLEALFVVMALVSALRGANRPQGYKWVGGGVISGLLLSLLAAFVLQRLFPAASSGTNREIIEGSVGIVAVFMILTIGAWLHSKSSLKAWQAYIQKQMGKALTTGSFISLFGLSLLAVFREGAETILFYVGILPHISTEAFALGVGLAVIILALLAVIILKSAVKLPVPMLFKMLTGVLYLLGFKILGVSVHALQLTNVLPVTIVDSLPNVEWLGVYATVETLFAQLLYIGFILLLYQWWRKRSQATV